MGALLPRPHLMHRFKQLIGLPLALAYTVMLLWASVPSEVRPHFMDAGYTFSRAFFNKLGVIPSHTVFGGYTGDWSRKYWAARMVGTRPDGTQTTLLEWPQGMVQPFFRVLEDPTDVAWYRHFQMKMVNNLMRARSPEKRAQRVDEMRKSHTYDRVLKFFCKSTLFDEHGERASVRLEVFYAGISYRTGEIIPGRATVHSTDCKTMRSTEDWPLPEDPPMWPLLPEGFDWETVQ